MYKLKKILLGLFAFFLLSFVFISNSYAEIVANELYSYKSINSGTVDYSNTSAILTGDFTLQQVKDIMVGYLQGDELYVDLFNAIISSLENDGNNVIALKQFYNNSYYMNLLYWLKEDSIDVGCFVSTNTDVSTNRFYFLNSGSVLSSVKTFSQVASIRSMPIYGISSDNILGGTVSFTSPNGELVYSSINLKLLEKSESNSNYMVWDGESYFYKSDTGSDTPTLPTNQEIASAVQKFYNSDIYKNNTNFKDFIVVYSSLKNTYAFIGTDNHLIQAIFYDGVEVPGMNFSSPDTWWMFTSKFGDIQSFLFGSTFYLYFLEGDSDVITYEGTGTLYDLFDSKYSMNMTIVYSTYDYDVIEYRPPAEGETYNQVTYGTIEGNLYTYDENLDPTDSQYSPLQNFVFSNPTQSILNDVDFNSINQAFEDSKGILNIQGASWIFTANNQLVEYFIGFITFLIILLVISRIMGG